MIKLELDHGIIRKLKNEGYNDIVEKLNDLYQSANDEGENIIAGSVEQFASFVISEGAAVPEVGINPDGYIQAIWNEYGSSLVMNFLTLDEVNFSILFNELAHNGQQKRVSGLVSMCDVTSYVKKFI